MEKQFALMKSMAKDFAATGTLMPSSSFLSKALTEIITAHDNRPVKILEAGAGTGPITKQILKKLRPQDHLTLCEMNPMLCDILRKYLETDENYLINRKNIEIFEGPVQDIEKENYYDFIVCSIPFLNFPAELAEDIFKKFHQLSKEEAKLSYFSYWGCKELGQILPLKEQTRRRELVKFLDNQHYFNRTSKKNIWLNLMPAEVKYYRKATH